MNRAITLAKRGRSHPNPPVGAVIVRDGILLGSGYHSGVGTRHAEHMALDSAKGNVAGADMYVTLEPCCHTIGRDNRERVPCVSRCIQAGLARLIIATTDVDVRTCGEGIRKLRSAGLLVDVGVGAAAAIWQQRGFRKLQASGRPFVMHKVATTLDGHTACEGGDSRWITSSAARKQVHHWRSEMDGILVGAETIIRDDPDLTPRGVRLCQGRLPQVVVFDRTLRIPITARVVRPGTTIITTQRASEEKLAKFEKSGCHVHVMESDMLDIRDAMLWLGTLGMGLVMLEAGGTLAGAFYQACCVDYVAWFIAPKLVGGGGAPIGIAGNPLTVNMSDAIELTDARSRRYGIDILITGIPDTNHEGNKDNVHRYCRDNR